MKYYNLNLTGNGKPYSLPTASQLDLRSKRSMEVEENREKLDNRGRREDLYENVPLKTGTEYSILVRAHVDQVRTKRVF